MKLAVRAGVFETNSSSTHSLTMVDADDFDKFKKGDLLYSEDVYTRYIHLKTPFCTWKEACEYMEKIGKSVDDCTPEDTLEMLLSEDFHTYDTLIGNEDELEVFIERYVSKSGDKIVAFGKYGYS